LKLKVNSGGYPICGLQKLQQALLVLPMSSCEMSQNKSFLLWKRSWDSEEGYCLHVWSLEPCYPILMNHISRLKLWCLVNPMKLKLLWHMTTFSYNSHQIIWSWFGHNFDLKIVLWVVKNPLPDFSNIHNNWRTTMNVVFDAQDNTKQP
jgi:hypothetical protein